MNVSISDQEFRLFQKLIFDLAGIYMNDTKRALIAGRLWKRLRHYGLGSYGEYYRLLKAPDSSERQVVVDLLTTHETYFFREPAHFDFLREHYVRKEHEPERPLRIWCCACSSGEEPYSIAMTLAAGGFHRLEILASDISGEMLEKAGRAVYSLERAQKIPEEYLRKFCLKGTGNNEGWFAIDGGLREFMEFRKINLVEDLPDIGSFDMIWLRNAMIYFQSDTRRSIIDRVVRRLQPGGLFFIGHSESAHGQSDQLRMVRPAVYRRITDSDSRKG